ncbi:MAG: site-2 protease family protein [Bacillota bacterium]|nr:site-2 protease family protein [Bacillota bacterium]NLM08440.1 site-2 protease family protein [Clostridiales Family XIII bacterium]
MRRFLSNPMILVLIMLMAFNAVTSGRYANPMDWIMRTLIILPGIILGLSFHEFAHAWVANRCGDPTPKYHNRITINPAAHIDPLGFLALIFIGFGWGRPVVINPNNFRKPRRDELLVSLAGVTMNLILAFLFMGAIRLLYEFALGFMLSDLGMILQDILIWVVHINIVLMVFNLLPIPPLDGFNVLTQIFNLRNTEFYYRVYDKGFLILMILIVFNVTGRILTPAVSNIYTLLAGIFF